MQRIQRKRTPGWRMPPGAKYVGRPTDWGNPYKVVKEDGAFWVVGPRGNYWHGPTQKDEAIEKAVSLYRHYLDGMIGTGRLRLDELRGHDLACFCRLDQPCHVDVILEVMQQS
jgi:Domain of unknown function (DUF4326)